MDTDLTSSQLIWLANYIKNDYIYINYEILNIINSIPKDTAEKLISLIFRSQCKPDSFPTNLFPKT